jgi:hypothetical protein
MCEVNDCWCLPPWLGHGCPIFLEIVEIYLKALDDNDLHEKTIIVNVSNARRLKNRKNDGSRMFLPLSLLCWLMAWSLVFLLVFGNRGKVASLDYAILWSPALSTSRFSFAMKYAKKEKATAVKREGTCHAMRDQNLTSSSWIWGLSTKSKRLIDRTTYQIWFLSIEKLTYASDEQADKE